MLEEGVFRGSYFGIEILEGDYDYQSLFQEALSNVPPHLYLVAEFNQLLQIAG